MNLVDEVKGYFKPLTHVVLATVEGDQPRLRPITLIHHKKTFYFATQSSDNKVKQITENPKIELILQWQDPPNNGYIRVEGKSSKISEQSLRAELFDAYDFMGKLWSGANDPNLTIYEITPKMFDYLKPGEWNTLKIENKI